MWAVLQSFTVFEKKCGIEWRHDIRVDTIFGGRDWKILYIKGAGCRGAESQKFSSFVFVYYHKVTGAFH